MALVFLVPVLLILAPSVHVLGDQPDTSGFISIDCGLDSNASYTDQYTGLPCVSDGHYIDTGENHMIAPELAGMSDRPRQTLRSFPSGQRNCYTLPTTAGSRYLVRAAFVYGNYDGKNSLSLAFDLYLGPTKWLTVSPYNSVQEVIFVASAGWTPVCLVDTLAGTPFISLLELRPLGALYPFEFVAPNQQMISLYTRRHMGANTSSVRFNYDPYDRIWVPITWATNSPRVENGLITSSAIQQNSFAVPVSVLQMVTTTTRNDATLYYEWEDHTGNSFIVILHFCDFQNTQLRQFNVYINENDQFRPHSPKFLRATSLYTNPYTVASGKYNFTLAATATSVLPPMLNAFEIYSPIQINKVTFHDDFDAIMAIKFEYGVKRNWAGDPCFPTEYAWVGVACSLASDNTTRITSLDLSNSSLQGAISQNFSQLTSLKNLDLSYNNLSGSIPDSLLSLPSLLVLNLSGNHLSSDSKCNSYTGSLIFRSDLDSHPCDKPLSSKKKAAVIAVSAAIAVLVLALLLLPYYIWRKKSKTTDSAHEPTIGAPIDRSLGSKKVLEEPVQKSEIRRFAYQELEKFTKNFKQFIGKGGFGSVYYGRLEDDAEVAVKILCNSSPHGLDEFLAEVRSLTTVHHRNLVSLIGYCWDKDHRPANCQLFTGM